MEITKEQVLDIYGTTGNLYLHSKLEKWFPEAFKVKLEVGKFYKYEKYIIKVVSNTTYYGFDYRGDWQDLVTYTELLEDQDFKEATTKEWQYALIAEAKKRGLYDAQYFKHANILKVNNGEPGFSESIDQDKIWTKYGCIYHKGVWAEIIKTFSKEEAEKLLGGKII